METNFHPIKGMRVFKWHKFELELDHAGSQILVSVREYLDDGSCYAQVQSAEEIFNEIESVGVDPIDALNKVLAIIDSNNR